MFTLSTQVSFFSFVREIFYGVSEKHPFSVPELAIELRLSIVADELQNIFLNCFNYCILTMFTTLVHCCGLFCSEETSKQTNKSERG